MRYSKKVYFALCPLTLGVMLACFKEFQLAFFGVLCALGSCIVYVSSNVFSKRVLFNDDPEAGKQKRIKMDKLNLIFWSAVSAFIVMAPGWFMSEGYGLIYEQKRHPFQDESPILDTETLVFYLFINGSAHFAQALLAITVLSSVSPVTYTVASLMKRVVVISCAVIWFRQPIGYIQGAGVVMTFWGLWLYDQSKGEVDRTERRVEMILSEGGGMVLPFSRHKN